MRRLLDSVDANLDLLNRSIWGVLLLALAFRFLIG
jgi:hypothetical protein